MTITRNFSVLANGAGSANTLSLGGATVTDLVSRLDALEAK